MDQYLIQASSSSDVWVAKSSRASGRSDRDIYLRHWDGSRWGATEEVGFDGEDDVDPAMTTDDAGVAWVSWLYLMPLRLGDKVYAASHADTGWNSPTLVNYAVGNFGVYGMSVCADGRPMVVWAGNGDQECGDMKYGLLESAGWEYSGLVNQLDDPSDDFDGGAELDRLPGGNPWIVWTSAFYHTTKSYITASRWTGSGWSEEEVVSVADTASMEWDSSPDVAVAPDGRTWAVWKRIQYSTGDTDIYVAYRDVVTAVDVWALQAEPRDTSVVVSWQASPEAAQSGFHVWRAQDGACPAQSGVIPAAARRLTDVAIRDCTSCSFTDDTITEPGTYCYWLEQMDGGAVRTRDGNCLADGHPRGQPQGVPQSGWRRSRLQDRRVGGNERNPHLCRRRPPCSDAPSTCCGGAGVEWRGGERRLGRGR